MESAGKGFSIARDMVGNEYAIRDLNIRVKHSELKHKIDLGNELDMLSSLTIKTSDGLSDFTSRVASVGDSIIAFDRSAIRSLQAITDRRDKPPSLPQMLVSSLSPLSAFEPHYKTEEEVKEVFTRTTSQMSVRFPTLIEEATHLRYLLRRISDVLENVKGLALEEGKDIPGLAVLANLWTAVARHDDYIQYKSHRTLLTDITRYYDNAMGVMQETIHALNKMRSDLNEARDMLASPALAWRDVLLEVTMEMMRVSMRRLEAGRSRIDGYEREDHLPESPSTRKYLEGGKASVLAVV